MSKKKLKISKLFLEVKLYKKLIGVLIKKGYKGKAAVVINEILNIIFKKIKISFSYLVWSLFNKLTTGVEIRKITLKGKPHLIPFKISINRQIYLVSKWILKSIISNTTILTIKQKVLEALLPFYLTRKNKMFEFKNLNSKELLLNKANLHFRW